MYKILIIEDDEMVREEVAKLLEENHYQTSFITDFTKEIKEMGNFDLILLDINLPGTNGFEICKNVKRKCTIPIVFVTSCNTDEDELNSIISGGDDFITKPYNKSILLEKIKRTLEKSNPVHYKELVCHDVVLDLHLSLLKYKDKEVELTRNEFRIMYYLFLKKNRDVTKEEFIEYLWNDKYYIDENILTVNINRVRKKLEDIGIHNFIQTIHGKGYTI